MTRDIYEKQHARIAADTEAFQRNVEMYKDYTFGLPREWFKDKVVLDAGCGNHGATMLQFFNLGVKHVYGVDVGTSWIEKLTDSLKSQGISEDQFTLKPGSVTDLPFSSDYFDFVACNGVLIHLENMEEIKIGFTECARTVKQGGYFYSSYGPCGGLIQGVIFPALRAYYRSNNEFKEVIDSLSPKVLHELIDKICDDHKKYTGEDIPPSFLKGLFGEDFCMFLHNYIQAPTWYSNECTPEFVEYLYLKNNFKDITRTSRFVKRTDIRKFFAPLHYDRSLPISKMLYGEGVPMYVGKKL